MAWKYKDETCECGASLKDIEPIRPRLFVTETLSVASCPECTRTPEIVEAEPLAPEPEPATVPEPVAEE